MLENEKGLLANTGGPLSLRLRDYQKDCVNAVLEKLSKANNALVWIATGGGKTEIMFDLCERLSGKILIVTHKVNLVEQTAKRAVRSGKKVSIYCKSLGYKNVSDLTIASVQSINSIKIHFDYIIVDECHKISDKNINSYYKKLLLNNPNAKLIGLTATPYRATGYIYDKEHSWFDSVTYKKGIKELIDLEYLVKPRMKMVNHEFDTKGLRVVAGDYDHGELADLVNNPRVVKLQIQDALSWMKDSKKSAWACSNIEHCEMVASFLDSAVVIHSKLDKYTQAVNMAKFLRGIAKHVVFVTMLSEGIDIPAIDTIVLMRPTRSPSLYLQICGRGLRPFAGKTHCTILDYGQVVQTLGPLDNPIITAGTGKKLDRTVKTGKFCPVCLDYNELKATHCTGCGEEFIIKKSINLTTKHQSFGEILSGDGGQNWIKIKKMILSPKISMSGRDMIEVSYYPDNKLFPIREYLVFGEHWMVEKSLLKLKKLGIHATSYHDAKNKLRDRKYNVTAIRMIMKKNFPEILEAKYELIQSL